MLTIEIIDEPEIIDNIKYETQRIIVNGIHDNESSFYETQFKTYEKDEKLRSGSLANSSAIAEILNYSLTEIGKHFERLSFSFQPDWWYDGVSVEIMNSPDLYLKINLLIDVEHWNKAWSISEFNISLLKTVETLADPDITADDSEKSDFMYGVAFFIRNLRIGYQAKVELIMRLKRSSSYTKHS